MMAAWPALFQKILTMKEIIKIIETLRLPCWRRRQAVMVFSSLGPFLKASVEP